MPARWVSICELGDLVEGRGRLMSAGVFHLAVFLWQRKVYALDHACPHAGVSLAGGDVADGKVTCPMHAWAFDLESGAKTDAPGIRVRSYPVRTETQLDGRTLVQVQLPLP